MLLATVPVFAQEIENKPSDWHVGGSVVYSSRTLDGSVVNKNNLSGDVFGTLIVTGDSMNVGDANGAMLALAVQYKRFGIGLNYMPTTFKGSGFALAEVGTPGGGAFVKTPLDTDIDIDMLLANVYYNFIQTTNSVFGVGAGFGQTAIDLSIVPGVGSPLVYEGTQPFGFLNLHMQSRYNKFLYGFALNGLSMEFQGANIVYSDYKVELGYRLVDTRVKFDLVGGYRMVNFAMVLEGAGSKIDTDVTVEGPFIGVNMMY
jgi:hypothetical protein